MTRIYLVRHAEAEGNLYRIAHGHYNGLITARGYKQIEVLRRRFEHIPIDAVYSSDLFRTRTTAKAVYLPRGLVLHTDPNLREVNMGVWEGQTWQQLRMEDEERIVDFNRHLDRWQVPGGETAQQVLDRFIPALTRIAQENDGKTVAVFSHGAALRIVLGTLEGRPLSELGSTPTATTRPFPCWNMTRTASPCCIRTTTTTSSTPIFPPLPSRNGGRTSGCWRATCTTCP